ncbi:MAG: MFS transporter [Sphingobacteriales bacterium]|nr:MAG: MFS transporter [Sphingobacteriales bacterium]TAF78208.1 MAG: MFS transporter [Sphingobacteriales bacterium]
MKNYPYIALKYPEFRFFLSMRFFFTLGYQVQAVIVGWYIYSLTKNPLSLGLIGLAEALPAIGIALYSGYIADKVDKIILLRYVLFIMLIASAILYAITLPSIAGQLGTSKLVLLIYVIIFVIGLARGFYAPSAFSIMGMIIKRQHYANSSTWNSSVWQVASIVGPALGGLMYGFIGINHSFVMVFVFLALSLASVFFIKKKPTTYTAKDGVLQSLSAGLKFVFKNKIIIGALSLDLFSVFFGGAVALIPVVAQEILGVGAQQFGFMRAAPAFGAVITMLAMTRFSPMNKPWRNLLLAITGFAISIICFGLSRNYYLSLLFLFLEGAFDSVSVIIRSTLLQILTPDDMRGRVAAVNSMFIGSSNEIGQFESGLTARLMGTIPAILFGGCVTLGVVGITWLKTKAFVHKNLDEFSNN